MNETRPASKAAPGPADNVPVFTVGELSAALKRSVEQRFGRVRVRGEITGFKRHGSGHLYFRLKDEEGVLEAVCWRGTAGRLKLEPEDGIEVICTGRLSTYALRSQYQIVVEHIELAGEGALLKLLEERKKKLAEEGLFDPGRKKEIPYLPEVIGVVTSPTGAVIRDILHRISERFPRRVLVWPVRVQGDEAAGEIAAAIEGFNRLERKGPVPRPDLLIVARGGGSLEDLWPFNEEVVVRAAGASRIPLISGVGHETDTTLIDLVADLRAPTPSAAAEMAVPVRAELIEAMISTAGRLFSAVNRSIEERRKEVKGLARGLPEPVSLLDAASQRLDDRSERITNAMTVYLERSEADLSRLRLKLRHPREWLAEKESRLDALGRTLRILMSAAAKGSRDRLSHDGSRLQNAASRLGGAVDKKLADEGQRLKAQAKLLGGMSYQRVLERGFALVSDAEGRAVTSVAGTRPGMALGLRFHDGETGATVTGVPTEGRAKARSKTRPKATPKRPLQGELL